MITKDYTELATRVLAAMETYEASYVQTSNDEKYGPIGHYTKSIYDAASEHARDKHEMSLIAMLIAGCWNDIQDWANEELTKGASV
jgi:hypothetical protein